MDTADDADVAPSRAAARGGASDGAAWQKEASPGSGHAFGAVRGAEGESSALGAGAHELTILPGQLERLRALLVDPHGDAKTLVEALFARLDCPPAGAKRAAVAPASRRDAADSSADASPTVVAASRHRTASPGSSEPAPKPATEGERPPAGEGADVTSTAGSKPRMCPLNARFVVLRAQLRLVSTKRIDIMQAAIQEIDSLRKAVAAAALAAGDARARGSGAIPGAAAAGATAPSSSAAASGARLSSNSMVDESPLPCSRGAAQQAAAQGVVVVGHHAQAHDAHSGVRPVESAVALSEARQMDFPCIFEQCSAAMAVTSIDGRFLKVNRRFAEMTGIEADKLRSRNIFTFIPQEQLTAAYSSMQQLISGASTVFQNYGDVRVVRGGRVVLETFHVTFSIVRGCDRMMYLLVLLLPWRPEPDVQRRQA